MEKNIDIYNSKENCNIKAKMFCNEDNDNVKEIFIFCHGFCSGKGSNSVKIVANELLKYGINSISFDFPGHGDSMQTTDKLTVDICVSYIDTVIDYIKNNYNNIKISFYAISFGSYILLNKLIEDKSEYNNIVLRSPAFDMKNILINSLLKEPFEEYKKNGKAKTGHGGKIEVTYSFYENLVNNDIYQKYNEKRNILIIQGALDDTAPIEDTYRFIENRPEIKLIEIENMKHHMEIEELEMITEIMLKELELKN